MKIIQFTENINSRLLVFIKKVFKENARNFEPNGKDSDILNITENYINDGNFWCLINTQNNICGTIALRKLKDCHEIRRFFILKKYQGCGYGTDLLNTVMNYAIDNNYTLLKAATMSNGYVAQHLFLKNRFIKTTRYNNSNADIFFQFEITRMSAYKYKLDYLKKRFDTSLILNPTENIPFMFGTENTDFFSGLYVSERFKDVNDKVIFAGRNEFIEFFQYIKNEWKKELGAQDVDLKSLSGLNAHLILFLCILKPGDKVMVLPEICGGHFATEEILNNIGATTYQMIPDCNHLCVNSEKTLKLIEAEKIDYVFVDRSEGLYYEDFSWLKDISNCYKIFDASQYISSILCNHFRNPFDMGFDMIITTLHKNYPGPQKGLLAVKSVDNVWEQYLAHAKTYISNTHPKAIADSLLPLVNKNRFVLYCDTCRSCINLLENLLSDYGVPIVKRSSQFVPTQHIWILCQNKYESYQYYLKLEALGLLTNYRLLPYELGYGLRVGLSGAVLCGLKDEHISELAKIMSDAYYNDITPQLIKTCHKFIKRIKSTA
jgi:glycine hydroxymethyltransferase